MYRTIIKETKVIETKLNARVDHWDVDEIDNVQWNFRWGIVALALLN